MVAREITVIKKARPDPIPDIPIDFPPLENLHLELMENKRKLKKNLPPLPIVKKKPIPDSIKITVPLASDGTVATKENFTSTSKPPADKQDISGKGKNRVSKPPTSEVQPSKENRRPSADLPHGSAKIKTSGKKISKDDSRRVVRSSTNDEDIDDDLINELGDDDVKTKPKKLKEKSTAPQGASESLRDPQKPQGSDVPVEDMEIDGEPEDDEELEEEGDEVEEEEEDDPYAGLSPEEREAREREEYVWRFRILKKKYKTAQIPEFNEHSDVAMMKQTYDRTVKELYLDESVDSYRTYLIGGFMAMELLAKNFLGVDLDGFTAHQMKQMSKYDSLLVELGERSYNRWGLNLPVEIRLLGFVVFQAGIFYVGKIIADKVGKTFGDMFKSLTGQKPIPSAGEGETPAEPKKRMRGPSIKVEDIKKMADHGKERKETLERNTEEDKDA
jgi:hypothetical protein